MGAIAAEHSCVDTEPNATRERRRASPVRTGLARLLGAHTNGRVNVGWVGQLPDGWHLVNDVPVGDDATIDHLLVGPAGVFAVNAKNVSGQVWVGASGVRVNGHATDDVWTLVHAAKRATRLLSGELNRPVTVAPMLAILADGWTIHETPSDLFIGPPRVVKDRLLGLRPTLDAHEVATLADIAASPATWGVEPIF